MMSDFLRGVVCSFIFVILSAAALADPLDTALPLTVVAQQKNVIAPASKSAAQMMTRNETPELKMGRRFPQKVKVGDLIALPVLDDADVTLGHVQQVVRTPDGKIKLIVSYSRWFGWWGRPVAVPIEVVAILGRQLVSLDMSPQEYERAPNWTAGTDRAISKDDIIRIAITRR
jgi:hypothetical protein